MPIAKIIAGFVPVILFLLILTLMDSYKLARMKAIILAILAGCASALICFLINKELANLLDFSTADYSRYIAPLIEEGVKAGYLIFLLKSGRAGFMVDAAIYGFAIGTGFALIENAYYFRMAQHSDLLLWLVRGIGTAILHGATTAIFGIISRMILERRESSAISAFLPGLLVVVMIHSIFNHFFLSPIYNTLVLLVILPTLVLLIFQQSEHMTKRWLSREIDADMDLLEIINEGKISETPIGVYLESVKAHFPGELVADMLCLIRLNLELALRAKGILLMRQTGFEIPRDPEIEEKFREMKYLEGNIGKTGRLAISPLLKRTTRDLWQVFFLQD